MKLFIDSYNEVFQNEGGGMQIKVKQYYSQIKNIYDTRLFDKWSDKISDCDVLHIFMPSIQNYNTFLLAKKLNKKVVLSSVLSKEPTIKTKVKNAFDLLSPLKSTEYYVKFMFQNADAIIAETAQEKDYVCWRYNTSKDNIFVIPNGVTINNIETAPNLFKSQYGISGEYVLQVGRFDRNKNQISTIRALRGTGIQLVLIGGPDKEDLDYYEECREEADENVVFVGWLEHESPMLVAAYKECHSFVLPSHHEILGNAMIEAAALGANIVSTNVLPLADWGIADMCYPINPEDVDDIRDKVITSLNTPKTTTLSKKIYNLFSWDSVLDQHCKIYESVLN